MYPLAVHAIVTRTPSSNRGATLPASTILLVEDDPTAAEAVSGPLAGAGYTVTIVADAGVAFRRAGEFQLVVIDQLAQPDAALDLCREIRATASLASIPVLCLARDDAVETRISYLEAGADDVVARPFDDRELEARVEALLLRFQRSRELAPALAGDAGLPVLMRPRRVVAVYSPKGGVGTTTIATNVALSMALRHPDRVCIVDLDLQFGQVMTHLDVTPRQTLSDVVRDEPALREPELLRTYATRHDTGLHVLAAPGSPELAELVTAAHVDALLETILGTYDSVVVDAGSALDERTMTVFEHADTLILPVYPEITALKALHTLLDYLNEAGSVPAKAVFVLNNMGAREILRLRDVESSLGTKVAAELPYDPFVYLKAVNEGRPVVAGAPKSAAAERLHRIATLAFGEDPGVAIPAAAESNNGRRSGLLSGLRRH